MLVPRLFECNARASKARDGWRLAQVQENDKSNNAVAINTGAVLIYTTFPSAESAEKAGGALVDRGLAACVNLLQGMTSIYVWQGKRQRDIEAVMIIKTRASLAEDVIRVIRDGHPYSNPALLVLPVVGGSQDFISWIKERTVQSA
jgi:periplasmic divalent cation tolerance protein